MNNKLIAALLLVLVVVSSGCVSNNGSETSPENVEGNVEKKVDVDGAGTIRQVNIDGDICYLYDWGNAGGLSCVS